MKLVIGYLYGDIMNTYGDVGNIITLRKRCEWRGIEVEVVEIGLGTKLSEKQCDLFFFGGGQDQGQVLVGQDLKEKKAEIIKSEVERGVPLLSICGGYQLLGEYYEPQEGPKIEGIGLFSVYTQASNQRMIGNIVIKPTADSLQLTAGTKAGSWELGAESFLIGFENHSGQTFLNTGAKPLGQVIKGFGNNGKDQTEGCVYKNAVGCYLHGSLLPKNPKLADWFIQKALEIKYGKDIELASLDDKFEADAHHSVIAKVK